MHHRIALILLTITAGAAPAAEEMPAAKPACAAEVAPSGALAPWSSPAAVTAGSEPAKAPPLTAGKAASVTLLPTPDVHYALRPEKPGGSVSYGGLLGLDVAQAGTYRIALSTAAWIDLAGKDGALRSVAHGHGPDCTGIRKMVDYVVPAGHYTLQISANGTPRINVLAVAEK
ncbi:MAG: hypothetical protein JSS42_09795 [Proteobacteria bacterium]|nr:hypothetical protein [Pseudomonadota bacterium]